MNIIKVKFTGGHHDMKFIKIKLVLFQLWLIPWRCFEKKLNKIKQKPIVKANHFTLYDVYFIIQDTDKVKK